MSGVSIRLVRTEQEWQELREFAKTFAHEIPAGAEAYRMVAIRKQGKLVGYCQLFDAPLMLPSLSTDPAVCSHRVTAEAMSALRDWAAIQHGIALFGIDEEAPEAEKRALAAGGIEPLCGRKLYSYEGG